MSNYIIAEYPQSKYRFELYDNTRRLSWQKIKAETGCYALVNLQYFVLTGKRSFEYDAATMVSGKWLYKPVWHEYGICIDRDGRLTLGTEKDAVWDYAIGGPPLIMHGKTYVPATHGSNGYTMVGIKADGTPVLAMCSRDKRETTATGVKEMLAAGCVHVLLYDGSWSTQGSLGPGMDVDPSQERIVRSYLLVYTRDNTQKEDKPMSKKVCLDPGHGVETAGKRSPDGTYLEHEFALDMAKRMQKILVRHGVNVTLTRSDEHCPTGRSDNNDLAKRVQIANGISGLDLFVSLHSNAAGNGSQWMSARGYEVYTSAAGSTANRNIAAKKVLARAKEAGIQVRSTEPKHEGWYVCVHTNAPAMLIEHLFHDNKADVALLKDGAYRDKLATANCKGILDYLGIQWQDEKVPEKPTDPQSWYADAQKWAVDHGISDGTRPDDTVTRAEVWTMLQRLLQIK